jgi:hypothetical protein
MSVRSNTEIIESLEFGYTRLGELKDILSASLRLGYSYDHVIYTIRGQLKVISDDLDCLFYPVPELRQVHEGRPLIEFLVEETEDGYS